VIEYKSHVNQSVSLWNTVAKDQMFREKLV